MCPADSTTNANSDSTVVYSDSETLSENDKPYFIDDTDASSDDNNGVFN